MENKELVEPKTERKTMENKELVEPKTEIKTKENKEYVNINTNLFVEGVGQVTEIKTINNNAVRVNIAIKTDNYTRYIDTIVHSNNPINKDDIVSFWGFYGCNFRKQDDYNAQSESSPKYAYTSLKNSMVSVIPVQKDEIQEKEQYIKIHIPAAVLVPLNNNGLFKVFPSGGTSDTGLQVDIAAVANNVQHGVYTGSVVGALGPTSLRYNKPSFYIYDATFCLLT